MRTRPPRPLQASKPPQNGRKHLPTPEVNKLNTHTWICLCVCVWTYLGDVVFAVTLLEGFAVVICRLVGQLGYDGVLHSVCMFNKSFMKLEELK